MSTQTSATAPAQVRLPGQAAAPEGPVDLAGMLAMHFAFRRDLDRFVAAVRETPVDDREAWRLLRQRWDLFCHILHDHHVAEDEGLWPELQRRTEVAGDSGAKAVLDAMAAEHGEIDPLLAAVTQGFARVADVAENDARAALEVRMVAARERLGHHLGHEERDALALVQAHMSQAEWEHFEKTSVKPAKSLSGTLQTVGWVLHDMPDRAVARVMRQAKPFLVVYRLFLRAAFARREREAFKYVQL